MKRLLVIFAFLLQLANGQQLLVRDAVGFVIVERDSVMTHTFFDRQSQPILAVPSSLIKGAMYILDNQVM